VYLGYFSEINYGGNIMVNGRNVLAYVPVLKCLLLSVSHNNNNFWFDDCRKVSVRNEKVGQYEIESKSCVLP
jgi:hypothetical protein